MAFVRDLFATVLSNQDVAFSIGEFVANTFLSLFVMFMSAANASAATIVSIGDIKFRHSFRYVIQDQDNRRDEIWESFYDSFTPGNPLSWRLIGVGRIQLIGRFEGQAMPAIPPRVRVVTEVRSLYYKNAATVTLDGVQLSLYFDSEINAFQIQKAAAWK